MLILELKYSHQKIHIAAKVAIITIILQTNVTKPP